VLSINKSLKSLVLGALIGAAALVAGCGGAGGTDPFDPGPQPPTPPLLNVLPRVVTVYSGVPTVLIITSGVGPFEAFSGDSVILPVTQAVPANTITLVANSIDASPSDRAVNITVRDRLGREVFVAVTVRPSPTLSSLNIIPISKSACQVLAEGATRTDIAAICSGETATARVTVRTANTIPIPNRQIKFDVVQGPYNFVTDQAGTVLSKTATIVTDQNGQAIVTIKSDVSVPSQVALIRATDLVSGNRVDGSFTIVQSIDGAPTLSVTPPKYEVLGYYVNQCASGEVDFVVYGGTPPYTVRSGLPSVAQLAIPPTTITTVYQQTVVVTGSGGIFRASLAGGFCSGDALVPFTITDAAGRIVKAELLNKPGTVPVPTPPAPATLAITPPNQFVDCAAGLPRNVVFSITGGTAPYAVGTDQPGRTTVTGSTVRINAPGLTNGTVINVTVADAKSNIVNATITCRAPIP
jgi:hypothetical protein